MVITVLWLVEIYISELYNNKEVFMGDKKWAVHNDSGTQSDPNSKKAVLNLTGISYDDFKKKVLDKQIENNKKKGLPFSSPISKNELDEVESKKSMKSEAAAQCRLLLQEARKVIKESGLKVSIGICSGYRTNEQEKEIWDSCFDTKYYKKTMEKRGSLNGGPHGDAAAAFLASYIAPKKAAPGYGKHSFGIAADFITKEKGVTHKPNTDASAVAAWKTTWFYSWLVKNAAHFKFKPLKSEPWHWIYS
jgi:hypothetical protein